MSCCTEGLAEVFAAVRLKIQVRTFDRALFRAVRRSRLCSPILGSTWPYAGLEAIQNPKDIQNPNASHGVDS